MNKILLIICCVLLFSCDNNEKSNELVKKANGIFINSELNNKIRIDSSLSVINKAIKLNENNFRAYEAKFIILSEKKDVDGMLKSSSKLIELRPNQPYWKLKKGFVLDLKNQPKKANDYYLKSIKEYKSLFEEGFNSFDLKLEYITALRAINQKDKVDSILSKMKTEYRSETQKQILEFYKNDTLTKEKIINIWKNS